MAKIRVYDVGQTTARALPNAGNSNRASASSFGGIEAQQQAERGAAVSNLGAAGAQASTQWAIRKDKALARDRRNKADVEVRAIRNEILNRKGEASFTSVQDMTNALDKIHGSMSEGMNARSKSYFDVSFNNLKTRNLNTANSHERREFEKWNIQTLDIANQNSTETAIGDRNNPDTIALSLKQIDNNTKNKLVTLGYKASDTVAQDMIHDSKQAFHVKMITALKDDSAQAANAYMKKYEKDIDPSLRKNIKDDLKQMKNTEEIRDRSMSISRDKKLATLELQLAEVDKIKDADVAARVRVQVKTRWNEGQAQKRAQSEAKVNDAWNEWSVKADPNTIPKWLAPERQRVWESYSLSKSKARAKGRDDIEDDTDVDTQLTLAVRADPDAFAQLDLNKFADKLSDKTLKGYKKTKKDILGGKPIGYDAAGGGISQQKEDALAQWQLKKGTDKYHRAKNALTVALANSKEAATPENTQKIIDATMGRKVLQEGVIYDSEIPFFESGEVADKPVIDTTEFSPARKQNFRNAKWDAKTGQWYLDLAGRRHVYNRDFREIASGKIPVGSSPKAATQEEEAKKRKIPDIRGSALHDSLNAGRFTEGQGEAF